MPRAAPGCRRPGARWAKVCDTFVLERAPGIRSSRIVWQADIVDLEPFDIMVPTPRLDTLKGSPTRARPLLSGATEAGRVLRRQLAGLEPRARQIPHDSRQVIEADRLLSSSLDRGSRYDRAMAAHQQHVAVAHRLNHFLAELPIGHGDRAGE